MIDEPLLTVDDLARLLCVPARTIYAWRYKGSGPSGIKVGRHLRFRRSDVEQWLRALESDGSG
jgi:excisionase family DNA binding protein